MRLKSARTLGVGLAVVGLISISGMARAASSQVNATICSGSQPPIVTVTNPVSDSTVNTPTVALQGTTVRTSQIDITLNGVYNSSIAVDTSQQFDTPISLQPGTNTIDLKAYFSCNGTNSTSSVIVSYVPDVVPSTGSGTATTTPPQTTPGSGSRANTISSSGANSTPTAAGSTSPPTVIDKIKTNLGFRLTTTATTYHTSLFKRIESWLSVIAIIAGLTAMITPTFFGLGDSVETDLTAFGIDSGINGIIGARSKRLTPRSRLIIRFSGLAVVIIFTVLLII